MSIRFLADANFSEKIIEGLCRREPAIDFMLQSQAGLAGKSDLEVLDIASSHDRVLVTHDLQTMPIEFGKYLSYRNSRGVLIVPLKLGIKDSIEELLLVWSASIPEEWENTIALLPL